MAGLLNHSLFFLRFVVLLTLLSCLSPLPGTPVRKAETFASLVAALPGEPRLVIWKSHYTLTLYKGMTPVKTYPAVFGRGYSDGDKRMTGDLRTPEGDFYICTMNPSKRFYKFMGLSYPGLKHAGYGLQERLISQREYDLIKKALDERQPPTWSTRLGGAIGIHGRTALPDPVCKAGAMNWTEGCIALANADVDEIFSVVALGTAVTVLP
jgi:murein L,D-transpeptidase YafK